MGKTALITGASSGIGFELAKLFAKDSYDLVLVARSQTELEKIARDLKEEFNVFVKVIALDLAKPNSPEKIFDTLKASNITIDVLVNNAGFGTYGEFKLSEPKEEADQVQVNVAAVTNLTRLFLPAMVDKKSGKILNIGSTAAFTPGPLMAVYCASKAYVLSFSQALHQELKGSGVSVSVLCPGPTDTGFSKRAHADKAKTFSGKLLTASFVAKVGYEGLMQGKGIIVPGIYNKFLTFMVRFVPREFALRYMAYSQRRA